MSKPRRPIWGWVRSVIAHPAVAASLVFAGGCSDSGGHVGADAGDAGGAGSGGTSGDPASGVRPPIPPAVYESCSALAPTYDGSDCSSVCASMRCDCDPFPASYIACHPDLGCVTAMDCSVACERDLGDVLDCMGSYAPCAADSDCGS